MGYISSHPQTNLSIEEFYQGLGYKYRSWLSEFNKYGIEIPTVVEDGETIPDGIQANHSINNWDFRTASWLFMREILNQWGCVEKGYDDETGKPNLDSYEWVGAPNYWNRVYSPADWVYIGVDINGFAISYALELLPEQYQYRIPEFLMEDFDWGLAPGEFYERHQWTRWYDIPPLEKYVDWIYGSFYGQIDPPQYNYWNCIRPVIRSTEIKRKRVYNNLGQLIDDEFIYPAWVSDVDEEIERLDRIYRDNPSTYGAVRYVGLRESITRYDRWYFYEGEHSEGGTPPYREFRGHILFNVYHAYWLTGTLDVSYYGSMIDKYVNVHMDINAVT